MTFWIEWKVSNLVYFTFVHFIEITALMIDGMVVLECIFYCLAWAAMKELWWNTIRIVLIWESVLIFKYTWIHRCNNKILRNITSILKLMENEGESMWIVSKNRQKQFFFFFNKIREAPNAKWRELTVFLCAAHWFEKTKCIFGMWWWIIKLSI